MEKYTPAVSRSLEFFQRAVSQGIWSEGDHIPSIKDLAAQAGVSFVSMWKAVNLLKKQGLIKVVKHGGITLLRSYSSTDSAPSPLPIPAIHVPTVQKWNRLRIQIEQDILKGKFPAGSMLPSLGQLQERYGICFQTLRKALDSLVSDNIVENYKKSYRIPTFENTQSKSSILLIGMSNLGTDELVVSSERHREFIRALEKECERYRIRFETAVYKTKSDLNKTLKKSEYNLGYILLSSKLAACGELIQELAKLGKPVALFDETGEMARPTLRKNDSCFRIFRLGNLTAGRQVGRYLLNLGHRNVAYLSPFHGSHWSQLRHHGLMETFEKAGFSNGVKAFCLNETALPYKPNNSPMPPASGEPDPIAGIGQLLKKLNPEELGAKLFQEIRSNLYHQIGNEGLRLYLNPLFQEALSEGRSAWVVANDSTALYALRFLNEQGARVPQDISLIGFDDSLASFQNQISSYNFSIPSLVYRIIHFLLKPETKHFSVGGFEAEGIIIGRKSTDKAKPRGG